MRKSDSMMIKLEICVICENTIQIDNDDDDPSFWGYDAQPIKEGVRWFDLHHSIRLVGHLADIHIHGQGCDSEAVTFCEQDVGCHDKKQLSENTQDDRF